jgi:hypothetical protein
MVVKVFEGGDTGNLVSRLKTRFSRIKRFRPKATRKASSELYIVALGHDGKGPPEWGDFLDDGPDDDDDYGYGEP